MSSMTRTFQRNIAKNRLKDMGVGNVNQKMRRRFGDKNTMPDREMIAKYSKTPKGRTLLAKAYKTHPALWTEVLNGSKKKDADKAVTIMNRRRLMLRHPDNPNWPKVQDPKKNPPRKIRKVDSEKTDGV